MPPLPGASLRLGQLGAFQTPTQARKLRRPRRILRGHRPRQRASCSFCIDTAVLSDVAVGSFRRVLRGGKRSDKRPLGVGRSRDSNPSTLRLFTGARPRLAGLLTFRCLRLLRGGGGSREETCTTYKFTPTNTMMATKQRTRVAGAGAASKAASTSKSAISIKGSTKIVTEFFEFSVNT